MAVNRRVRDVSGHRHHGLLIGYDDQQATDAWDTDVPEGAGLSYSLRLAGTASGQFVAVGPIGGGTPMHSFTGYFHNDSPITSSTARQALFAHRTVTNEAVLVFGSYTSHFSGEVITFGDSDNRRTAVIGITIAPGWHLLELRWDEQESRYAILLDGVAYPTIPGNSGHTRAKSLDDVRLGRSGEPNGGYGFAGKIADFRFLDAEGLMARYDFRDGPTPNNAAARRRLQSHQSTMQGGSWL